MSLRPISLLLSFLSLSLGGCSIYQSDGRKFLEKNAFEYAGVNAQANLQDCGSRTITDDWQLVAQGESHQVFVSEHNDFSMTVLATHQENGPETFGCSFHFQSAQELVEKTDAAVALTLLHLRLGEFAFQTFSPVK